MSKNPRLLPWIYTCRLVTGGIIVVDDYNAVRGATEAVDRFIETKPKLEKLPFYHVPSFIRKPEIQT